MRVVRWNQSAEPSVALQKRLAAQVLSVEPDQIESVIARLATAGHEVIVVRASLLIQHHDIAIQDRPLPFQTAQNLLKKVALRSAWVCGPCLNAGDYVKARYDQALQ